MKYFLLEMNLSKRRLTVRGFTEDQISLATNLYNRIEAENLPDIDVVLVSTSSFDTLREAYPNYFADVRKFISILTKILCGDLANPEKKHRMTE